MEPKTLIYREDVEELLDEYISLYTTLNYKETADRFILFKNALLNRISPVTAKYEEKYFVEYEMIDLSE